MKFETLKKYRNGSNLLIFKPCTVEGYTNYMHLDVAINDGLKTGQGLGTENLLNGVADFKNQGLDGVVVFEYRPINEQRLWKNALEIMEHYLETGVCRVEMNNGKRIFIIE